MGLASNGYHRSGLVIGVLSLLFLTGYVAGQCKIDYKSDYKGGRVLNNGKNTYTSSDWECCKLCNRRYDCKSWARVAWSRGNHRKGDCWLHGDGTHKIWAENINSGRKGGGPTSCKIQWGLEYKGGSTINNGKNTITRSDQECCALCDRRSDCKYWTRTRWWNNGSLEGECWMRKYIGWKNYGQNAYNSGSKG